MPDEDQVKRAGRLWLLVLLVTTVLLAWEIRTLKTRVAALERTLNTTSPDQLKK